MKFTIDSGNWICHGIEVSLKGWDEPQLFCGPKKPEKNCTFTMDVVEGADEKDIKDYIADKVGLPSDSLQVINICTFMLTCLWCYKLGKIQNAPEIKLTD